jgi:hypothetical protein
VTLVPFPKPDVPFHHLHLKVKPDSVYKDDYDGGPADRQERRVAGADRCATVEEDICEIRLLDPKINAEIDRNTFKVNIPRGFAVHPPEKLRREK